MKLYHGTTKENAEKILRQGILTPKSQGIRDSTYIWLTFAADDALNFGECVFEVSGLNADKSSEEPFDWQVCHHENISVNQLKKVR